MAGQMSHPVDVLLGRRTYEIFAAYWPHHEAEGREINAATKFVASRTLRKLDWANSRLLQGDVVGEIRKIQKQSGPELQVHGSGNLVQTLLKHDLVDAFWLKIFPI